MSSNNCFFYANVRRMTKLTYVFPCLAGCLRITLPLLPKWDSEDFVGFSRDGVSHTIWLSLWVALVFLTLCIAYGLVRLVLALSDGNFKGRGANCLHSVTSLCRTLHDEPVALVSLLNCVAGALELLLVMGVAALTPSVGAAFILVATSVGLLFTALALDLTGWVWVRQEIPRDISCVGASIVFLGLVLLLMHPASVSTLVPSVNFALVLSLTAGCASAVAHVLTHKLSMAAESYWGGTSLCAGGQIVVLLLAGLIVERGSLTQVKSYARSIWYDIPTALLCIGIAFSQLLGFACIQFFGSAGGYFTAFAPFVGGQVLLGGLRDVFQGQPGYSTPQELVRVLPCTPFCILGLFFAFFGSVLMWVGRWTTPLPFLLRESSIEMRGVRKEAGVTAKLNEQLREKPVHRRLFRSTTWAEAGQKALDCKVHRAITDPSFGSLRLQRPHTLDSAQRRSKMMMLPPSCKTMNNTRNDCSNALAQPSSSSLKTANSSSAMVENPCQQEHSEEARLNVLVADTSRTSEAPDDSLEKVVPIVPTHSRLYTFSKDADPPSHVSSFSIYVPYSNAQRDSSPLTSQDGERLTSSRFVHRKSSELISVDVLFP